MGDPSHFNLGPVPPVAGNQYNFKEWLGRSVVLSVVDFVKVKDPPLLFVFVKTSKLISYARFKLILINI